LAMVCTVAIALMVTAAGAPMEAAPFDGKRRLVFSCSGCPQKPSGPSLYVVNASGTGCRRIETPRLSPYGPRWSPNGRRIAVSSRFTDIWSGKWVAFIGFAERKTALMVVRADGTHPRFVARGLPLDINCSPSWSPDGRHIVFAVQHEFDDYDGHELMVATLDGAPPRAIVIPELPPSAYSELYGLDWS
jgi:Tol biopolymer transport system component